MEPSRDSDSSPVKRRRLQTEERAVTARQLGLDDEDASGGPSEFHCDSCNANITAKIRIACAICPEYDLCVDCFCRGAESKDHRADHDYIPIGRNDFPLFHKDWTADEELALLEGVAKFGLANWKDVAEAIAPHSLIPKSKDVCERHYNIYFLSHRGDLDEFTSQLNYERVQRLRDAAGDGGFFADLEEPDEKPEREGPRPQTGSKDMMRSSIGALGYMPLRGDFDREYDNDAELIIADMEFRCDEPPQEKELKLAVMEAFNCRLDERKLRKRVVIERNLVDGKRTQLVERRRTKEEREVATLLKPLARFNLDTNHEQIISLIVEERRLLQRIQKLQEWCSVGLTTMQDVQTFEMQKQSEALRAISSPIHPPRPVDDHHHTGRQLLSDKELQFCRQLDLSPLCYLVVKSILLREADANSEVDSRSFGKFIRLDAAKRASICDFVIQSDFASVADRDGL